MRQVQFRFTDADDRNLDAVVGFLRSTTNMSSVTRTDALRWCLHRAVEDLVEPDVPPRLVSKIRGAAVVPYDISVGRQARPDDLLPRINVVPFGTLVVIHGRAPAWRYAMAIRRLRSVEVGAGTVAVYDANVGAVVVAAGRGSAFRVGETLELEDV